MTVHQCELFKYNYRLMHERAVRNIDKYLASMSTYMILSYRTRRLSTCGFIYNPDKEKGTKFYTDTHFSGGWDQADDNNAENIMSHT